MGQKHFKKIFFSVAKHSDVKKKRPFSSNNLHREINFWTKLRGYFSSPGFHSSWQECGQHVEFLDVEEQWRWYLTHYHSSWAKSLTSSALQPPEALFACLWWAFQVRCSLSAPKCVLLQSQECGVLFCTISSDIAAWGHHPSAGAW